MSRYGIRVLDPPQYVAGRQTSVKLAQDEVYRGLHLRLRATNNVAGGSGAGTYHTDGIYRNLRSFKLTADGQDIINVSGRTLAKLEKLFSRQTLNQTQPTNKAAASTGALEMNLEIPFYMPHSDSADSFGLPAWAVNNPTLYFDWGNPSDMIYSEDGTFSLSGVTVELFGLIQEGAVRDERLYSPLVLLDKTYALAATGTRLRLELDNAPREVRGVLLEAEYTNAIAGEYQYTDAMLTDLTLRVGGVPVIERVPAGVIQNRNKKAYGLAAVETGVYMLDAAEDKQTGLGELWMVGSTLPPVLEFDATKLAGDNQIRATVIGTLR